MEFKVKNIIDLTSVAAYVKELIQTHPVVLLKGSMGVGKTTFSQELLRQLGIEQLEGSPTYSLINSYQTPNRDQLYHLDLYRLKSLDEAYDIGIEEVLDGKAITLIEWPDLIERLLYGNYLELIFTLNEDLSRTIQVIKKVA